MKKILVVGAGPAGLSAALWLKINHFDVQIIEKSAAPTHLSKAIGINPRTLELFEETGLSTKIIAKGHKVYAMNFRQGNQILLTMDFTKLHHRYNFVLMLPQATTEALLLQNLAAQGCNVSWQNELIECHSEANAVRVIMQQRELRHIKHYDYLVGADGAHSKIRDNHEFSFIGKTYPDDWCLIDITMDWIHSEHEAEVFLHDDGVVLFVAPLGNHRYRLVANTKNALDYLPLGCQIERISWQSNFTVQCRQVEKLQNGRIFLVGDAAHVHSPAGGRGMNLGIEDAYDLASMLAAGKTSEYSVKRQKACSRVLADTDRLFRIAAIKNPVMRYLRNHLLFSLFATQSMQQRLMQRMAGLVHP